VYEIRHYLTQNNKDVFMEWRKRLRDTQAKIAIDRRVNRIELGNFGAQVVLLLCGGDKRTQDADIDRACEYWADWQKRS
jgi:putative component of toxin-antitoxin plasmid stabilization module